MTIMIEKDAKCHRGHDLEMHKKKQQHTCSLCKEEHMHGDINDCYFCRHCSIWICDYCVCAIKAKGYVTKHKGFLSNDDLYDGKYSIHIAQRFIQRFPIKDTTTFAKKQVHEQASDKHGNSELHYAVDQQSLSLVQYLLDNYDGKSISVNKDNLYGWTPLHVASQYSSNDSLAIFKLLIEKNGDINKRTRKDSLPIHIATQFNSTKILSYMVNENLYVDKIHNVKFRNMLLLIAAKYNSIDCVKYFCNNQLFIKEREKIVPGSTRATGTNGKSAGIRTALDYAAFCGNDKVFEILFSKLLANEGISNWKSLESNKMVNLKLIQSLKHLADTGFRSRGFRLQNARKLLTQIEKNYFSHDYGSIALKLNYNLSSVINAEIIPSETVITGPKQMKHSQSQGKYKAKSPNAKHAPNNNSGHIGHALTIYDASQRLSSGNVIKRARTDPLGPDENKNSNNSNNNDAVDELPPVQSKIGFNPSKEKNDHDGQIGTEEKKDDDELEMNAALVSMLEHPLGLKENSIPTQSMQMIDRWKIIREIGKGGFGRVMLGIEEETEQYVALKFINKNKIRYKKGSKIEILNQFIVSEIKALEKIRHKNVIQLYGYNLNAYKDDNNAHIVMLVFEYAQYGELFKLLQISNYFDIKIAKTYFEQIISALKACHRVNIVHRDLKPQNLLIDSNFQLKIADFGLCSITYDSNDLSFGFNKDRNKKISTLCWYSWLYES